MATRNCYNGLVQLKYIVIVPPQISLQSYDAYFDLNFPGMATHDCYIGLVQLKNIVKVLPKHPYRVTVLILIIIF